MTNKPNTVVEADERNDDDRKNAPTDVWSNGNEKEWEQSDSSVVKIDD